MTRHTLPNADDSHASPPAVPRTYAAFRTGTDELVIYDISNHRAWIQSDTAVAIVEMV